ncbi:5740_t:CDS:2 [Entrophospora sp. SA101]|nr:5740_t:CDS:2 [Entrophospora sp. SA101]
MNNPNPILENLQQRVIQEQPVKLIYADNDFSVFDKGSTEFYGSEDEFISDQPLEGINLLYVETNCETPKSKVLTIDPDFLDDLEIHFLADVARDSNLNPYKLFKAVITKKLENGVLATIHDEKSVFYRIINPEEIQHEKTLGGGMENSERSKQIGGYYLMNYREKQLRQIIKRDYVPKNDYQTLHFQYQQTLNDVDYQLQVHTKKENEELKRDLAE